MRLWSFALVTAAIAAAFGTSGAQRAVAAAEIGSVHNVLVYAYGTPPAIARQPLYLRDDVVTNEVVETAKNGALHIRFLDGTDFRLGSASRATLDQFLYDPGSKAGQLTLSLKEGIFRLKTGTMKKEGIRVVTPVANISVTGTDVVILVLTTGEIFVAVLDGGVLISPLVATVARVSLNAPATAQVDGDGTITPGVDFPRSDPGLDDIARLEHLRRSGGENRGGGENRSSRSRSGSAGPPGGPSQLQ